MQKVVCIDPGHGGKDPGAVFMGRKEKDDVLMFSNALEKELEKQGIKTHMIRRDDLYVELYSRPKTCNNVKADIMVSVHRNAFANSSANGVEIWIKPRSSNSKELATNILGHISGSKIQSNRGIKEGNYVVLDTGIPSILLELGFITNSIDNRLFDENFSRYVSSVARGICDFLELPYNSNPPQKYIRIQLGAYSYPENEAGARRILSEIREIGRLTERKELENAFLVIPQTSQ